MRAWKEYRVRFWACIKRWFSKIAIVMTLTIKLCAIKAAISQVDIIVLRCHLADRIEERIKEGQDVGVNKLGS